MSKQPSLYALFNYNAQMWFKEKSPHKLELCEIQEARLFELADGAAISDLAEFIKTEYPLQQPQVVNAMLVPVEEKLVRIVAATDDRPKRDWDHLKDFLND